MPRPGRGEPSQGHLPAYRRRAVPTREYQCGGQPIHTVPARRPIPRVARPPPHSTPRPRPSHPTTRSQRDQPTCPEPIPSTRQTVALTTRSISGLLRLYQGDAAGAEEAFQFAVASGHAEAAPEAATWLGGLLARRGDPDAGRAVLRQAVASGHYRYAPEAAMAIGMLLADQGGLKEAMAALSSKLRPVTRTCRRGRR